MIIVYLGPLGGEAELGGRRGVGRKISWETSACQREKDLRDDGDKDEDGEDDEDEDDKDDQDDMDIRLST